MIRVSLEARILFVSLLGSLAGVSSGALLQYFLETLWLSISGGAVIAISVTLMLVRRVTGPMNRIIQAMSDGVASFKDGDFSVSLGTDRKDELGELVEAYNSVGDVLRKERQSLFQRELLLDTVIQATPLALVLTDPVGRIVYSNTAARRLFLEGRRIEGHDFRALLREHQPEFAAAVEQGLDGLFTVSGEQEDEVFHLSHGNFTLNARRHQLFLFRQMTHELNRQEVVAWKKVIRVISHELNNSLAPISSVAHSGREFLRREDHQRLDTIFATIEERSSRLKDFIEGYARFAKLPMPRPEWVDWSEFMAGVQGLSSFRMAGRVGQARGWFDPAQLQQVMINLLKNATETGCDVESIEVELIPERNRQFVCIRDRGEGMSESVLRHALLPFYSTKQTGSGLGLPLCREIIEAHGGRLRISNRDGGGVEVSFWLPVPQSGREKSNAIQ